MNIQFTGCGDAISTVGDCGGGSPDLLASILVLGAWRAAWTFMDRNCHHTCCCGIRGCGLCGSSAASTARRTDWPGDADSSRGHDCNDLEGSRSAERMGARRYSRAQG